MYSRRNTHCSMCVIRSDLTLDDDGSGRSSKKITCSHSCLVHGSSCMPGSTSFFEGGGSAAMALQSCNDEQNDILELRTELFNFMKS